MEIKAKYDQLISTPIYDIDGKIIKRIEHYHFTIGKLGEEISGGFYIKKGISIPDTLIINVPEVKEKDYE